MAPNDHAGVPWCMLVGQIQAVLSGGANPAKIIELMNDPQLGPALQKLMSKFGAGMGPGAGTQGPSHTHAHAYGDGNDDGEGSNGSDDDDDSDDDMPGRSGEEIVCSALVRACVCACEHQALVCVCCSVLSRRPC